MYQSGTPTFFISSEISFVSPFPFLVRSIASNATDDSRPICIREIMMLSRVPMIS